MKEKMKKHAVRVGIDVGGTHTKAVAIDNDTHEIIGKASVNTTHHAPEGVAKGVVEAFDRCLKENNLSADDVVFIAHSTTQATNALLEGDVAQVGVLGILRGGLEDLFAKPQMRIKDISLGTGRMIPVHCDTIRKKDWSDVAIREKIQHLKDMGATVLVTAMPFGVDHITMEKKAAQIAINENMPVTVGSEITKLYGLTRRTRTAVINASILPKMLSTSKSTLESIQSFGVKAPLMIMRGDGGVMDIEEMKVSPIQTMLSGPAASVMGALMYLRVSNGIYFEVGGTSTNIGVIRNGRPTVDYSTVGEHKTYVNSLDIRVLGVAGGSMVRVDRTGILDVGPRSAHIAGMEYSTFTNEKMEEPKLILFSPTKGDSGDYCAIELNNGHRVTITVSCAANILGMVEEQDYAYGNVSQARMAMKPLADYLGKSVEETAEQILFKAFEKINGVVAEFTDKYKLDQSQMTLIGAGGGAASLIRYTAEKLKVNYRIPEHAEVISSIGVALAMVREVVERTIPSPSAKDIHEIKMEALSKVVENGANPESAEVHVEIDPMTAKISAIATGSTEAKATDLQRIISLEEAAKIAATDLGVTINEVILHVQTPFFYVFESNTSNRKGIRIIDKRGFIRMQRSVGIARKIPAKQYKQAAMELWDKLAVFKADGVFRPDFYLCIGARMSDFSFGNDLKQLNLLLEECMDGVPEDEEIIIIGVKNEF